MKYPLEVLRPEVDSYYVASVNERYQRMNDSYNNGDYGEIINYARSMVESVCKYVYRQVNNSRMEDDIKVDRLPKVVSSSLEVLRSEMSLPDEFKKLADDMSNTMVSLGKVRNKTSVRIQELLIYQLQKLNIPHLWQKVLQILFLNYYSIKHIR